LNPADVQEGVEMLDVRHDEGGYFVEPASQAEEDGLEPILTAP
jgi:hypothetical protein